GEAVLRHRGRQVVAGLLLELEEVLGDAAAHDVQSGIVTVVLATTGPVVAGHRSERARLQFGAEHVQLSHVPHDRTPIVSAPCLNRPSGISPATRTSPCSACGCRTARSART